MGVIIREVQINLTMRYNLTPATMAIIYKFRNEKSWHTDGGNGTLLYCLWECRLVWPLWKAVWNYLKKLKMQLLYDPAISVLGI